KYNLSRFVQYIGLPDIVILCDTRCNMENHFSISSEYCSFSSFNGTNTNPKRGVTLLIKKYLNPIVKFSCEEGNLIKVQCSNNSGRTFDVIGIYGPNNDDRDFYAKKLYAIVSNSPTIIGGDFNIKLKLSRDTTSKSTDTHPNSKKILRQIMSSFGFKDVGESMNNSDHTFFSTDKNHQPVSSRIDMFLVKGFGDKAISSYDVIDAKLSDHKAIQFKINVQLTEMRHKNNWILNSKVMENQDVDKSIKDIIEDTSNKLQIGDDVFSIVRSMMKKIKAICRMGGQTLVQKKHAHLNEVINISNSSSTDEIKKAHLNNIYREEDVKFRIQLKIDQIKDLSYSRLQCAQQVRMKNKSKNMNLIDENGQTSKDPKLICSKVNTFYSNLYACHDCMEEKKCERCELKNASFCEELRCHPSDDFKISEDDKNVTEKHFTTSEIEYAILKSTKHNKSPGPSGFTFEFYKKYVKILSPILLAFYEKVMSVGAFPSFASEGRMVLIPKPNKNHGFLNNYRPLTLQNSLYKIFSYILVNRLSKITSQFLNPSQHGFIKNKLMDNIPFTIQTILESRYDATVLAIDFAKAFDSISHRHIIRSMYRKGFGDFVIRMVGVILTGSKTIFSYGIERTYFETKRGVKQGDPVSALIFNIAIDQFLSDIQNDKQIVGHSPSFKSQKSFCYADDLTLLLAGSPLTTIKSIKRITTLLKKLYVDTGLKISSEKTEVISVYGNLISKGWPNFQVSENIKLLGSWIGAQGVKKNTESIVAKISQSISHFMKLNLNMWDKKIAWNTYVIPQIIHLLRLTPYNEDTSFQVVSMEKRFLGFDKKRNISDDRKYGPIKTGGLAIISVPLMWKVLNLFWVRKIWEVNEPWSHEFEKFLKTKNQSILENPHASFSKTLAVLSLYSNRMRMICEKCKDVVKEFEKSLGWALPIKDRFCFPEIRSLSADIAADLPLSNSLMNRMAGLAFKEKLSEIKSIQRPLIPFKMKMCIVSTKDISRTLQRSTEEPFIGYLQRRKIKKDAKGSIKQAKNKYLTTSEKWFKYRLLSGTLEVRAKFFEGQKALCYFCMEANETTDHLFWDCNVLENVYQEIIQSLYLKYGTTITKEGFLAYYDGKDDMKINAIITKVQNTIYGQRSSGNLDKQAIIPIFNLYCKVVDGTSYLK
ncbi:LINE-1 reverse transcriptase, partial [Caligus rogercresseyi]